MSTKRVILEVTRNITINHKLTEQNSAIARNFSFKDVDTNFKTLIPHENDIIEELNLSGITAK